MNRLATTLAISALLLPGLAPPSARAADAACNLQVEEGWVRLGPAGMPMLAGFGRIANPCRDPATIAAASSPAFAAVELHESRVVDGVSRMRAVPALRIGAGEAAVLAPGGLHLMLMRPHAPLRAGTEVQLELELADGRRVDGRFEVRAPDAR
jgi:copper(I)-binding protein